MTQTHNKTYIYDFQPISFKKEVALNERHAKALDRLLNGPGKRPDNKKRSAYSSKKLDLYLQNPPKKSTQRVLISISAK